MHSISHLKISYRKGRILSQEELFHIYSYLLRSMPSYSFYSYTSEYYRMGV